MILKLQPLGAPAANYNVGGGPEARARRLAHAFPNAVLRLGGRVLASKANPAEDEVCREKASLL